MAISVSIQNIECSGDVVFVSGKLIPSGNYVSGGAAGGSGGDVVNWNNAVLDPLFSGIATAIPSSKPPTNFEAYSQAGLLAYLYGTQLGTTLANSKLIVQTISTQAELASGAYPAAILADVIGFTAIFNKFQ